jgi:copper chaperone CopZ
MATETVRIDGMGCGHCVDAVRRSLESLPGVSVHEVRLGEARVSFDERATNRQEIEGAIRKAGYTPVPA